MVKWIEKQFIQNKRFDLVSIFYNFTPKKRYDFIGFIYL